MGQTRGGDQESLPLRTPPPPAGEGWRSVLSNQGDSYKARGTSAHGGVTRGLLCLERFRGIVNTLGDQFQKTRRQKSILEVVTWSPGGRDTKGKFGSQCPVLFLAKLRGTQLPLSSRKGLTLPLTFCVILGKPLALSGPPSLFYNRCGGQVA